MLKKHMIKLLSLSALAIVGVMAVSASAAQGAVHILLNGTNVNLVNLNVLFLHGELEANGLVILCEHGKGTAHATTDLVTIEGLALIVFTDCVWVGSEGTCTINDPETGVGTIHAHGEGEVYMEGSDWFIEAEDSNFATIHTEGIFCNIPAEEVVSGGAKAVIHNAEEAATSHSGEIVEQHLFLGENPVERFVAEAHVTDEDPTATLALHL